MPDATAQPPAVPSSWSRLTAAARRHQKAILIVGSLVTAGVILALLWKRRHEFGTAISDVPLGILVATSALQVLGLVGRSESWHQAVRAAGAKVSRRVLFRASAMQVLGSIINGQLGVAMRIAALRKSSPEVTPKIPTLIAAELPIVAVELMFAAVGSFTLVGPLGIPWWSPIAAFGLAFLIGWGMRRLSHRSTHHAWAGLTVLRHPRGAALLTGALIGSILCQVVRNWMLLRAVGVDASFWDGVAVLIAVASLAQLPTGPAAGAAAAVLILGSEGVAATAAAGVLMTVTGTIGGLIFAAWSGGDQLWAFRRARRAGAAPPGA
ncbi:hypothetical protein AB0L40_27170 [Patulibacter sp. NPDC049589]|uniref:hypothetical protein n=1 Tax=Patulibacter sp. NPDC049589 TaxID=3154731 RepID=UPI00343DAFA6